MIYVLVLSLSVFSVVAEPVDLSYTFDNETIYWPGAKNFELDGVFAGLTASGFFYATNNFEGAEHGGTHLDAPYHFSSSGQTVEEILLSRLIGPAFLVDVASKAASNPDYLVHPSDLPGGANITGNIVLVHSGWGRYWPDKKRYLGNNQGNTSELHFPGLSVELAKFLVAANIKAVGIDTASIDYGQSSDFKVHQILGAANIPVFENVANLDRILGKDVLIIALPMAISGGTGAPLRIVAMPKEDLTF